MTLHTYTPNQCPQQVSTSHTLRFPRYSPDKILKVKVTTVRSKVKSRSDHDVAHLQPLNNIPCQVSTSYTLWLPRYSPDKIFKLKVTTPRSNQGQTMTLHTYTPQPMSLPSMNFLHLTVSEIQPGQTISRRPPARPSGHHG